MPSRFARPMALSLAICAVLGTAAPSAAQTDVDGCTAGRYLDRTAAGADREFVWDFSFAENDPEQCITIRAGQRVKWVGNFNDHPLDPDEGDTPNPIANHVNGGTSVRESEVTFDRPGVFGYRCNFHLAMRGAVRVLPASTPVPALGTSYSGATLAMSLSGLALAAWWLRTKRRA